MAVSVSLAQAGCVSSASFESSQSAVNNVVESLENLRQKLLQEWRFSYAMKPKVEDVSVVTMNYIEREEVLRRLEYVVDNILTSLSKDESPSIVYNSRSTWQNIRFTESAGLQMIPNTHATEVRFDSLNSVNKFATTLQVMAMCYKLVQSNTFSTKRDVYYSDCQLYGSQSVVDGIIDNISCMIKVPREALHVLATSKGWIAGAIQFKDCDAGHIIDCSKTQTGIAIPANINAVSEIASSAKMVLIVEKDAIFQKLLDDKIFEKLPPCILITGRGFPDVGTRKMIKKLWNCLLIPILALVDADPHGMEILFVYKYGSRGLSFDNEQMAVPVIKWLGVLPSDIDKLHLPRDSLIPLSKPDLEKARDLMKRPYYMSQPMFMTEMQILLSMNRKAEIEALTSISRNYLTDVYLPTKIANQEWI
ncbi:meiotic recombination protein SPO11-like [Saccoglossus kowalevskii]|uniref:DNA topoisomerase (ATP-hydrolyzing) n=1 Tax=Saccoglossus kowalevskii TaxID=10224 RepID=A0ABM0M821_SACKO|nr:PREDICTED: meiotic recombination protein SPO11-like [Saccoglossus kowalevskii]